MSYLSLLASVGGAGGWLAMLIDPELANDQMREKYSRIANFAKRFTTQGYCVV
jgi:hypothetical protein